MLGSFLPSLRSSSNHSLLGSRSRHCYAIKSGTTSELTVIRAALCTKRRLIRRIVYSQRRTLRKYDVYCSKAARRCTALPEQSRRIAARETGTDKTAAHTIRDSSSLCSSE